MADFDICLIDPASASEAEGGGESARLESARERQRLSHRCLTFHVHVKQASTEREESRRKSLRISPLALCTGLDSE